MISPALALALFQDSTDQTQQQLTSMMSGLGAGIILVGVLFVLILIAILIVPIWRILTKMGLAGALSLLIIIPWIGWIILLYVVAFSDWRIVSLTPPRSQDSPALPPYPPPPPPPPAFPPQS
jgi:uncharacterized membrane protein YhaH (DUF805 family)